MNDPAKAPVEFVAIINSFNRRELLQRAVSSLATALRTAPFASAIIVFEAGSNDGSSEFLEEWREANPADHLSIIRSSTGKGSFSDGVNAASSAALARFPDCRWLFLYETDNWLASAAPILDAVSLLQAERELGAAGFSVRRHNGEFCGYGTRFPTYFSLGLGLNLSALCQLDQPNDSAWQTSGMVRWRTCDVIFTSPLLIRREAWEATAGFDAESFPFSDSDLDWAWRGAALGWKMAVIDSTAVVHDNLQQSSAWSANRVIEFHRSRLRLLKRYRGNRDLLLKPALFLRHCLESILLVFRLPFSSNARDKLARRGQMLRTVWNDYS